MWTILPIPIIEILTSQTGINRGCQKWILQVGISEIKLLISDFSIVDFRFSGIAICDF